MNERVVQFRVGVVVVAAATVAVFLIMIFGEGRSLFQAKYTIYLHFPEAPGVAPGTPVQKNGVNIGRISEVRLDDDTGGVTLAARIDSNRRLYTNEVPVLQRSSLLGDAVLEFVSRQDAEVPRELLQSGSLLADGRVASDPMQVLTNLEEKVASAIGSIDSAATNVDSLAGDLKQVIGDNDQQVRQLLEKTEQALDQFSMTMNSLDRLLGDDELNESLKRSLQDLPETLNELKVALGTANETLSTFDAVGKKAEQNLDNLDQFTRPLGERGGKLMDDLDDQVANIDELLGQLITFSKALNNPEGSLGKLVHDPELYNRLNDAAGNVERASRRVEPILRDVRTLTDKLARDPRQLGVKGALDRRPLGMGLKTAPASHMGPTPAPVVYGEDIWPSK